MRFTSTHIFVVFIIDKHWYLCEN